MKSPAFAGLWAKHSVRSCVSGTKQLRHPVVGHLEVDFEVMHLPDGSGQRIITYTAAPGTGSEAALRLLGAGLELPAFTPAVR